MQPMAQVQSTFTHTPPTDAQLQKEIVQSKPRVKNRLLEKIRRWEATGQLDHPFDPALEPPVEEDLPRLGRLVKL
jgi:hypothetical protein